MPNCIVFCAKEGFEGQATWPLCLKRDQENMEENIPEVVFHTLSPITKGPPSLLQRSESPSPAQQLMEAFLPQKPP